MPLKVDNKRIANRKLDKRVKLTEFQRAQIKELKGTATQKAIADRYGVDRRTVSFIWFPEQLERNKALRDERGGSKQYYDREKHRKAMAKHRKYKKSLDKKGLL